jgi:hypothetical protein
VQQKIYALQISLYVVPQIVPFTVFGVHERSLDKSREAPENKLRACVSCETRQRVVLLPAAFLPGVNNPSTSFWRARSGALWTGRAAQKKTSSTQVARSYKLNFTHLLKLH